MNVALFEPEIPQNTGNIGRLCVATGVPLHLVGKLGFRMDDRYLKRAGLDYWEQLDLHSYRDFDDFETRALWGASYYFFTTKGKKCYSEIAYRRGDFIIFGPETRGLPEAFLTRHPDRCIRIPMVEGARSLNLSNAASIVLYEALRQTGFPSCPPVP